MGLTQRERGAYYSSKKAILMVIHPLFLEELQNKLNEQRAFPSLLEFIHDEIANIKILDPACGDGAFLIHSYLALKELEDYIRCITLGPKRLSPKQFYGIELDPHAIQSCIEQFKAIDDSDTPNLLEANALRFNWEDFLKPSECSYIIGNPPFRGFHCQTKEQKEDMKLVFKGIKATGILDYCSCWFLKAAQYIQANPKIEVAFISTNSIYQGTQVATLWQPMIEQYKVIINFAHKDFVWKGEGKNDAKVVCSISSFSLTERENKRIWDYTDAA